MLLRLPLSVQLFNLVLSIILTKLFPTFVIVARNCDETDRRTDGIWPVAFCLSSEIAQITVSSDRLH